MTKLKAENGVINAISEVKQGPISVKFTRAALNPNGDIGEVKIYDEDGAAVYMTYAQAVSLANVMIAKCSH